jgi:nucleotide-binding universal stress UspA family protein
MPRGRAADVIVALTRENPDAIVVISSHGRGDLGRALIGSVADQVVRRAHCPVMVVRDEVVRDDWQLRRIMVTLDGSRLAEDALQPATALAHAAGATLDLLRVVPPYRPPAMRFGPSSTYSGSYIDPAEVARLERRSLYRGRHYLGKKFEELANEGLTVEGEVVPGTPVEQIVAAGERNGADLIVIASHGRGGLKRWMVGSIANAVLRQARVPVLIVPHPDSAETRDEQVRTAVA